MLGIILVVLLPAACWASNQALVFKQRSTATRTDLESAIEDIRQVFTDFNGSEVLNLFKVYRKSATHRTALQSATSLFWGVVGGKEAVQNIQSFRNPGQELSLLRKSCPSLSWPGWLDVLADLKHMERLMFAGIEPICSRLGDPSAKRSEVVVKFLDAMFARSAYIKDVEMAIAQQEAQATVSSDLPPGHVPPLRLAKEPGAFRPDGLASVPAVAPSAEPSAAIRMVLDSLATEAAALSTNFCDVSETLLVDRQLAFEKYHLLFPAQTFTALAHSLGSLVANVRASLADPHSPLVAEALEKAAVRILDFVPPQMCGAPSSTPRLDTQPYHYHPITRSRIDRDGPFGDDDPWEFHPEYDPNAFRSAGVPFTRRQKAFLDKYGYAARPMGRRPSATVPILYPPQGYPRGVSYFDGELDDVWDPYHGR